MFIFLWLYYTDVMYVLRKDSVSFSGFNKENFYAVSCFIVKRKVAYYHKPTRDGDMQPAEWNTASTHMSSEDDTGWEHSLVNTMMTVLWDPEEKTQQN